MNKKYTATNHTLPKYIHVLVPVLVLYFVLCTWDFDPCSIKYIQGTKRHQGPGFPEWSHIFKSEKLCFLTNKTWIFRFSKNTFWHGYFGRIKNLLDFWYYIFSTIELIFGRQKARKNVYFCTSKSDFISKLMYLYFVHWNSIKIENTCTLYLAKNRAMHKDMYFVPEMKITDLHVPR